MRKKIWYEVKIIGGDTEHYSYSPFLEATVLAKVRSEGLAYQVKCKFEELYVGAKIWVE